MEKGDYLTAILRSDKTIFSVSDVALLWQESNLNAIRVRLNYYARNGDLYRIRRNFYAKDKKYDRLEFLKWIEGDIRCIQPKEPSEHGVQKAL